MEQFETVLEIFSKYHNEYLSNKTTGSIGGCVDRARNMQAELEKNQVSSVVLRVFSEIFDLEHVCGGLYALHDVVYVDGLVLDPNLELPVKGVKEYLHQAFTSKERLVVESLSNGSIERYF